MGVTKTVSTLDGGLTPICSCCGIALCWDIPESEYTERQAFWDAWRRWIEQQGAAVSGPSRVP